MSNYLPLARILLRYLFGGLGAAGMIDVSTAASMAIDPDMALIGASAIGTIATEAGYLIAKRRGGAT